MRCFYHGDVEAVALCKACSRAICHECCSAADKSAACRSRCEADVQAIDEMIERNKTAFQKTSGAYTRSGWFSLLVGAVFAGLGFAGLKGDGEPAGFLLVLGAIFLLYGISQFFTARRFRTR